jgi:hypothetical protein
MLEDHLCNFWFKVFINDKEFVSPVWEGERQLYDIDWTASSNVPDNIQEVSIKIKLFDNDNVCDLNGNLEKKHVELLYDISTGHWSGDDYLGDLSGYGRLNGCDDGSFYSTEKDSELWFNIFQTDYDNDNLPYFIEVNEYLTDPEKDNSGDDSDYDKIPIDWEHKWRYDPNTWSNHGEIDPDDDSISNYEEYLTSKWNSDPYRKDIFVELDQMEKGPNGEGNYVPENSKELLKNVYDRRNFVYHFDDGCMGGGGEIIPFDDCTYNKELLNIYTNFFLHNDENNWRRSVFRYGVFIYKHYSAPAHAFVGEGSLINSNVKGINCFEVSTSAADSYEEGGGFSRDFLYASYILHETGHTLRVDIFNPMGCDNYATVYPWFPAYWIYENYKSVMNYRYFPEIQDYSDGTHGENDYNDWENLDLTWFEKPDSNPPNIPKKPSGPVLGKVGVEYEFTTSTDDPDGEDLRYVWDWGDESPHQWTDYIKSGDEITVSHIFEKNGTFEVRVRSEDIHGAYSYFSDPLIVEITVDNNPPSDPVIRGPSSGSPDKEYEYTFTSSDPDKDEVCFYIDWGDSDLEQTDFVSSGESVKIKHVWSEEGSFTIKVKAVDESDAESDWISHEVKITKNRFRVFDLIRHLIKSFFDI